MALHIAEFFVCFCLQCSMQL